MPLSETVRKFRRATQHVDSPRPKYTKSSQFKLSQIQKFPGKYEEILFFRLPARCVNVTFARQWYTFHYENELPSLTCSHYHMSRKLPGKLQETILSQPFFSSNKGRYACHIRRSFPKGDSSYHTRPRPAYQELLRASARVQRHIESS